MTKSKPSPDEESPLIIQYTNLLHKHRDPNAEEVKAFVEQHKDDVAFVRRAEILNKVSRLKDDLSGGLSR